MTIVGFNFNKISVERRKLKEGKVSIDNNVAIKKVESADLTLGSAKQKGVRFEFEFKSKYDPDFAEIILAGEVLYLGDEKSVKTILSEWKKKKTIPQELTIEVLNTVLNRSTIQALVLAKEVNLPSPIPLQRVTTDNVTK